jgi:glyoxylase-like metal-dependent hydrolase (beta-lactamase superfamily II)
VDGRGFEVAPGLHRIEAPLGDRVVACHLVVGERAALLVDTGVDATPAASLLPYCDRIGLPAERVRWVVVSHCDVDHMGGDAAALEAFGALRIVAHEADRPLIEDVGRLVDERYREFAAAHGLDMAPEMVAWCHDVARAAPVDVAIEGAATFDLGGRRVSVLPTPGHSPGSISVHDPASGALITSDAVLGSTLHLADGRPAFPPTYRHPEAYRATIASIAALDPGLLLTAHEPVMDRSAARAFLVASRSFTDLLESEALQALREAPAAMTLRDLIEHLAPRVGRWEPDARMFLAHGLLGHLEELEASGSIARGAGTPASWTWRGPGGS